MTFDDCSGDYWVLDALGHYVVQRLIETDVLSAAQLQSGAGQSLGLADDVAELEPALSRLREAGLIQPARVCAA